MPVYEIVSPYTIASFEAKDDVIASVSLALVCQSSNWRRDGVWGPFSDSFEFPDEFIDYVLEVNLYEVHAALNSFGYVSAAERAVYNDALAAITDSAMLKDFKLNCEVRCRANMGAGRDICEDAYNKADCLICPEKCNEMPF